MGAVGGFEALGVGCRKERGAVRAEAASADAWVELVPLREAREHVAAAEGEGAGAGLRAGRGRGLGRFHGEEL